MSVRNDARLAHVHSFAAQPAAQAAAARRQALIAMRADPAQIEAVGGRARQCVSHFYPFAALYRFSTAFQSITFQNAAM